MRVRAVKEVVSNYETSSSQLVNFDKSLIYFSNNTNSENREQVTRVFEVRISSNLEKYLGLPTMVERRKKQAFFGIKESMVRKIKSWNSRFLSIGGKEVMIKEVLQAIPIYAI